METAIEFVSGLLAFPALLVFVISLCLGGSECDTRPIPGEREPRIFRFLRLMPGYPVGRWVFQSVPYQSKDK